MSNCSHCGALIREGANFCASCGTRVTSPPKVVEEKAKSESGEERSIEKQRENIQEVPRQASSNEPHTTVVSVSMGSRRVLGFIFLCVGLGLLAGAIVATNGGELPSGGVHLIIFIFLGGLVAGIFLLQGIRWLFKK
jgi:hypothetical protein